jgi:hypothetical protein
MDRIDNTLLNVLVQLLLIFASAVIFGFESRGTRDHILLSQFWDFPFRRPLRLAGLRWRYSTPPPHDKHLTLSLANNISARATQKHPISNSNLLLRAYSLPRECVYRTVAQKRTLTESPLSNVSIRHNMFRFSFVYQSQTLSWACELG